MLCQKAFELMSAALDGESTPGEQRGLREHLGGCELCRARRSELLAADRALRAPAARSAAAPQALRARIERSLVAPRRRASRWALGLGLLGAAAAGAALVLLLRPAPPVGFVGEVAEVEVEGADGRRKQRSTGAGLRPGDRVRARQVPVRLRLGARAVATLERGAVVRLLGGPGAAMVERGRARFEVTPGRDEFRVRTPVGDVVVLGTAFEVRVAGGESEGGAAIAFVSVSRGAVRAESGDWSTRVHAGESVTLMAGRPPVVARQGAEPATAAAPPPRIEAPPPPVAEAVEARAPSAAPPPPPVTAQAAPPPAAPAAEPPPPATSPGPAVVVTPSATVAVPWTGTIRGKVELTGEIPGRVGRRDPRCPAGEGLAIPAGPLANAFVRVTSGVPPLAPRPRTPIVMELGPCSFAPRRLAVALGQSLELRNLDEVAHVVRFYEGERFLFSVTLNPKEHVVREMNTRGYLRLRCDRYVDACGMVDVSDHGLVAITDAQGAFAIEGVPPGRYTLTAWRPLTVLQSREVFVTVQEAAEVRIALPPVPGLRPSCRIATQEGSPVAWACEEGGIRAAKLAMKELVKAGKAKGVKLECDNCHKNDEDWALTADARERFQKLLAVTGAR
jgi:hypothetical protein